MGGPWYVGDALGSVRQTLDDAGAVLATTSYDPWGTPQGTLSAPFGFTGELHSAGQVYLRARWYAPGQGRFVSEDPFAGFAERPYSLHAYQYGYSNPLRWTDPTGTIVCLGVCIGLLVTGGVIILAAVTHEATRSTQMAGDTMPPLDPSMVIPMPDAATQARNRADFMRGVAYLQNPGAYVWVTPPMDPGPPDPVGYAGPSLQYPSREDLTVRSPRTGPEEVCVVWPGPSRQASLWPLTTGAPGEQVDAPLVFESSAKLDRNLGGTVGDQLQAHHLIPEALRQHSFVRRAKGAGWDHDAYYNGILLPDNPTLSVQRNLPQHNGSHGPYNDRVRLLLNNLESLAQLQGWTDQQAYYELQQVAANMRTYVVNLGRGGRIR